MYGITLQTYSDYPINRFPLLTTFDPVNDKYGGFIGTHFMTISTVNYEPV